MVKPKDGDFIKIEFVGKKATGEIFDTNIEQKAKEANVHNPETKYGPSLVVLGKGEIIKGLEKVIVGMEVGESRTIEIMPEDAFGERKQELVRVMPLSEFRKRDMDPHPGMQLQLDNMTAVVKSVTSGRVMVDLNHPLAGHKVIYELKLNDIVEGTEKKAMVLMEHIDITGKMTTSGDEVRVHFGPEVEKDSNYLVKKAALADRILGHIPEVVRVKFEEIYERANVKETKIDEAMRTEKKKEDASREEEPNEPAEKKDSPKEENSEEPRYVEAKKEEPKAEGTA
ncbi:MAG: peptidylprolyl isomerase [Candidatus Micrarchaeota archaeon]